MFGHALAAKGARAAQGVTEGGFRMRASFIVALFATFVVATALSAPAGATTLT